MNLSKNTILITGGSAGIGLDLAKSFLKLGNEVIICGRKTAVLEEVQKAYPEIHIYSCDIQKTSDRKALVAWLIKNFPTLNILINNAGIQREFLLKEKLTAEKFEKENEIETNLVAPIHLTMLLLPHLIKQENSAIVNIASGLAFVPVCTMPVYCATKSALQSFTQSLRFQLTDDATKVFCVYPPRVNTALGTEDRLAPAGISVALTTAEILKGMQKDELEIHIDKVKRLKMMSRFFYKKILEKMNAPR